MSKDLRDLIETVEEETKTRAKYEQEINVLQEEINKLNFTIKEQKLLIEDQKSKITDLQEHPPEVIETLKDIIASQKQEILQKDNEIDSLNKKIENLPSQLGKSETFRFDKEQTEELNKAKKLIDDLIKTNEENQIKIETLEEQLKEREKDDQIDINERLIEMKKKNFQLMEENSLLKIQIESLRAKINEMTTKAQEQKLELENEKIEKLVAEIEDYKEKVTYLKEKESAINAKEVSKVKEELLNLKNENQRLKNLVETIKQTEKEVSLIPSELRYKIQSAFPKLYQISLFRKMYHLMNEKDREILIKNLLEDLNNKNNEIKRFTIEFLSEIKDKKVYEAFLQLMNDSNWFIRYNVIKAISKFTEKKEEVKEVLKKLTHDSDVDVRELAKKKLNELI